jgi:hypothetical protein
MGEHSKPREGRIRSALTWGYANRRRIALVGLLALPLVARYVPEFPTEEAVRLLRLLLGSA